MVSHCRVAAFCLFASGVSDGVGDDLLLMKYVEESSFLRPFAPVRHACGHENGEK
jgi:hypothetical protein